MKSKCLPKTNEALNKQEGFSVIELIIVIMIGMILTGATIMSFSTPKKYATDDQILKVFDVVQEARQRAINQKSIMRVEFNNTKNQVRLIDENKAGDNSDDLVIRTVPVNTGSVTVGTHPQNVSLTNMPQESSPVNELVFANSKYPSSLNQSVFTLCFVKDGRVVETSADGSCVGTNNLRGATVYVYATPDATGKSPLVRALTISGITSAGTVYRCVTDSTNTCTAWKK